MGLKRTVPPDVGLTVVSLEEARTHLRLPPGDGSLDSEVTTLVKTATEIFEEATWRALLTQTWRLTLNRFPCEIVVPRPPLQQITSIQYVDEDGVLQTLAAGGYLVAADAEPATITPAYGEVWPTTRCAGYGDTPASIPEGVRQAIKLMIGDWFKNREANISGTNIAPVPMGAQWLLAGYKVEPDATWFHLAD
jgi:uncharacterized phiE125 gp8 family phage protein